MTDKEKLEALLTEFGVPFNDTEESVTIEQGYVGFYTQFDFDDNGKFQHVGAYA